MLTARLAWCQFFSSPLFCSQFLPCERVYKTSAVIDNFTLICDLIDLSCGQLLHPSGIRIPIHFSLMCSVKHRLTFSLIMITFLWWSRAWTTSKSEKAMVHSTPTFTWLIPQVQMNLIRRQVIVFRVIPYWLKGLIRVYVIQIRSEVSRAPERNFWM